MTKIGNKMRVSFQYKDAETKKTVGHTFNDVNPNATVEAIRSVKEAIDAVSAEATQTIQVTENYQILA